MALTLNYANKLFNITTNTDEIFHKTLTILKQTSNHKYDTNQEIWHIPKTHYNDYILKEISETLVNTTTKNNNLHIAKSTLPLFNFQQEDFKNLYHHLITHNGVLLCNEPGLGKTVEAIAIFDRLHKEGKVKNCLISCHTVAMKPEWERQIKQFISHNCQVIDGTKKQRIEQYKSKNPIHIISHNLFGIDFSIIPDYDFIIIDETVKIKGYKNKNTKNLKRKLTKAKYKILLTGTPLENNLIELYNITSLVRPRHLGTFSGFSERYLVKEKLWLQKQRRFIEQVIDSKNLEELNLRMRDCMVRRTKQEVAPELPPIINMNYYSQMEKEQIKLYKWIDENIVQKALKDGESNKTILQKIMFLRRVVDHSLLIKQTSSDAIPEDVKNNIKGESGKLKVIDDILPTLNIGDEKVIIFSQWAQMVDIIYEHLRDRGDVLWIHGGTKYKNAVITDFKTRDDKNILIADDLLSHGQNLSQAQNIIQFDIPFNPAICDQRAQRAHRVVGTMQPINSIYIYTQNSIESEFMLKKIRGKIYTHKTVIDDGKFESSLSQILLGKWA